MAALPDRGTDPADMAMRVASAVLGDLRADAMRDRVIERAEQVRRVGRAAAFLAGKPPSRRAQDSPTLASAEAARRCHERIEALDADLRAIAWRATGYPVAAGAAPVGAALDGFAVAIKDIIDVAGMPTRCGSALTATGPAPADATVVGRLRSAGAAIIGKTHCTEWALNDPAPTRNPWDASRTPGGSSAGSAVAVAAGMCRATVDTQTAGDVLRPAAYNGVVGFKPSGGWAPLDGVTTVAPTIDTIGITARHLSDATVAAAAIADDPASLAATATVGRPRIGVLTGAYFGTTPPPAGIERTIGQLKAAGAVIVELRPPVDLFDVHAAHRVITFAECAWYHRARYSEHRQRYGIRAQELIDLGLTTLAHSCLDAQRVRRHATAQLARLFENADVLAMPVAPRPAPARTTTGDSAFQIPWTLCGFPALSLPTGLEHTLPQAIQLIGPPHRDGQLLAASRWCEQVIDTRLTPPLPT